MRAGGGRLTISCLDEKVTNWLYQYLVVLGKLRKGINKTDAFLFVALKGSFRDG